jgi:hypothetical protein
MTRDQARTLLQVPEFHMLKQHIQEALNHVPESTSMEDAAKLAFLQTGTMDVFRVAQQIASQQDATEPKQPLVQFEDEKLD